MCARRTPKVFSYLSFFWKQSLFGHWQLPYARESRVYSSFFFWTAEMFFSYFPTILPQFMRAAKIATKHGIANPDPTSMPYGAYIPPLFS
jgi:hypothetical protein